MERMKLEHKERTWGKAEGRKTQDGGLAATWRQSVAEEQVANLRAANL